MNFSVSGAVQRGRGSPERKGQAKGPEKGREGREEDLKPLNVPRQDLPSVGVGSDFLFGSIKNK